MNKSQTSKLLNKIKGYYNSQFFIDDYVIEAWSETMEEYDLEDSIEHLQEYLKEYPNIPPKPHTFIKGLLTPNEKKELQNKNYLVQCNLCNKWMSIKKYDEHYDNCLDIEYLIGVAKKQGKDLPREDLESAKPEIISKLMLKYKPKEEKEFYKGVEDI